MDFDLEDMEIDPSKLAHFIQGKCFTHTDLVNLLTVYGQAHRILARDEMVSKIKDEVKNIENYHANYEGYDDTTMQQDILILLKSIESK